MKLLIRIPLRVDNLHALAGYFTDGPNFMALNGLVSQLEDDAVFQVSRFGLVLEAYEARHAELLTTGLDATAKGKQREGTRSGTGYRYANLRAALYLETDPLDSEDLQDLLQCLELSINGRRFQGGNLVEYVSADPNSASPIKVAVVASPEDWASFVAENEKPLSALYLSKHLPEALAGGALIEAYAQALTNKANLMVCNGYICVGALSDAAGELQNIGEPSFTLAETVPVYQLRQLDSAQKTTIFPSFFWSFDQAFNKENPNHYILT